jgi:CHAD domain-containing protein
MLLDYVILKEVKPALAGYIKESQTLLRGSHVSDEKVIHSVRVLMKKSRAALKLTSTQLDRESFDRDMLSLKRVGRLMSTWRDTSVHRNTLKELKKKYPAIFFQIQDNEKIKALLKKTATVPDPSGPIMSEFEEIEVLLKKTSYRIRFHSMNNFDPDLLLKELEMTYYDVVDKYLICRNCPKPSNFHEFRKKTKDFLFQLYFFRPLNPVYIKNLEKKLDKMTRILGKHHDLTQIVKALEYKYPNTGNLPPMDEFVIKIREMQDLCLLKVWTIAGKIFRPGQKLEITLGFKLIVM